MIASNVKLTLTDDALAIPGGGFGSLSPKVGSLTILETTEKTLTLEARVNFTNPTEYSAYAPYVNIHILNNNTLLGHATAQNVYVSPGRNDNVLVQALWDPSALGGKNGSSVGRELLSQYVSGNILSELATLLHSRPIIQLPCCLVACSHISSS